MISLLDLKRANNSEDDEKIVLEEFDDNFATIEGLYVQANVGDILVHEEELKTFTGITKSSLTQKLIIPYIYDIQYFIQAAKNMFDEVEIIQDPDRDWGQKDVEIVIWDVKISYKKKAKILEWNWLTTPKSDLITDTIGLIATQISANPPASMVKNIHDLKKQWNCARRQLEIFSNILSHDRANVSIKNKNTEEPIIVVSDANNEVIAEINYNKKQVKCEDQSIKGKISELLEIHHHSNYV